MSEENEFKYTFTELPVYKNGIKLAYGIEEKPVDGYETYIYEDNGDIIVTNMHIPEVLSVPVEKTWLDDENRDGIRPESITINLLADGEIIETREIEENIEWKTEFVNLPKYRDEGQEIIYTVTEEEIEGYNTTYYNEENKAEDATHDILFIVNSHEPELINISGTKTWVDWNDKDKIRPETITVILYANGEELQKTVVNDPWTYEFVSLFKYENGKEIVYTIDEEPIEGYDKNIEGFDITNTHVATVDLTVRVHKVSSGTKLALKGAEVTLFNEDGTIAKDVNGKDCIKLTDENGNVEFVLNCEPGTKFYVQETKAPAGYHINPNKFEVIASIDDDNILDIGIELEDNILSVPPTVITNNPPKTGDTSNIWLYGILLIGAITTALVLVIKKRHNK